MESTKLPPPPLAKRRSAERSEIGLEPQHALPAHDNGGGGHEEFDIASVKPPRAGWLIVAAIATVALLVALLLAGMIPRYQTTKELDTNAADALHAPILVNVVLLRRDAPDAKIFVPGNLRPWQEVSIFARTTGYLKKYNVDISEQVKQGDVMAEIETPEVDQQLHQRQAALLQTKAAVNKAISDRDLSKVTDDRYQSLAKTNSVTPQDLDQKHADLAVNEANLESAKANVAAAEANVARLTQMQQFEKVIAPFSGVVTGRAYDVGSLILADPTATDVKPMFKIAENDVLRVFVNVPQSSALQILKGMEVQVTARELPNQTFKGFVMGTTNYLDQTNRSLLTEVKVLNIKRLDGEFVLLPGMYVTTTFLIKRDKPPLIIPGPAIVNNSEGTRVATIKDGLVHFVKVELGEDSGATVEVVGGLNGDEQIIANPGERIVEGVPVKAGSDASATP